MPIRPNFACFSLLRFTAIMMATTNSAVTIPTIPAMSRRLKPPTKKSTNPVTKRMMAVDMFIVAMPAQKAPSRMNKKRALAEVTSPFVWYSRAI